MQVKIWLNKLLTDEGDEGWKKAQEKYEENEAHCLSLGHL